MLRPFETVLVHPFRSKFIEIHVKKYKKITHELNELRKFGDMRHPTSRYSHGLGWMWPGLERRRAASNARNDASMLCKQQTFDNKSCNNYLSFTIFREGEISVLSSPCASATAFHS